MILRWAVKNILIKVKQIKSIEWKLFRVSYDYTRRNIYFRKLVLRTNS